MAELTSSDVTYTKIGLTRIGTRRRNFYTVAFGDGSKTYPSTGVPLDKDKLGMKRQLDLVYATPENDTIAWVYDNSNTSLRAAVANDIPFLVVEEKVLLTSSVGTMSWRPAYILGIEGDDGTVHDVIPDTETAGASDASIDYATGQITVGTGPSAHVLVTYVALQPTGLFSSDYLVIDEAQTVSAGTVTLDNRAACVQYVYDATDNTFLSPIPEGETPVAESNNCEIDINSSENTVITVDTGLNNNVLNITYLKHIGIGGEAGTFGFVDTADLSLTSQAYDFLSTGGYKGLVLPGYGTRICGENVSNENKTARLTGPNDSATDNIAVWDPSKNTITANDSSPIVTFNIPLLLIDSDWRYTGAGRELYVTEAPPAQTLRVEAVGW